MYNITCLHVKIDIEYHSLNQPIVPFEYLSSSSQWELSTLTFEKLSRFKSSSKSEILTFFTI